MSENRRKSAHPIGAPSSDSLIFLVGYRGTGKTTVARVLARRLGWTWVDADETLEKRQGRSIRRIFAEDGESKFRDQEAAILEEICRLHDQVVATGGGVVLRTDNRDRMKAAGRIVWLQADIETIWSRLQTDATTQQRRPDLSVGGKAEVEALLRLREPLYRACADLSVATDGSTPEEVATAIMAGLC